MPAGNYLPQTAYPGKEDLLFLSQTSASSDSWHPNTRNSHELSTISEDIFSDGLTTEGDETSNDTQPLIITLKKTRKPKVHKSIGSVGKATKTIRKKTKT